MKPVPRSLALVVVDLVAVPAAVSEIAGSLSSRIQTGAVIMKMTAPFFCLVDRSNEWWRNRSDRVLISPIEK